MIQALHIRPWRSETARQMDQRTTQKGYIKQSNLPQAAGFFFVAKKDPKKRHPLGCQDYNYLNKWTKLNAYPLLLISDLMLKLTVEIYHSTSDCTIMIQYVVIVLVIHLHIFSTL